jgi:hypothetical protein
MKWVTNVQQQFKMLNNDSYRLDYGAKKIPTFTEPGTFCTDI